MTMSAAAQATETSDTHSHRYPQCPVYVDFVEEPPVLAPALGICGDVSEVDSWHSTSCGEDGRRERNELRQFPEVLGCGG
jgi:hypothetical protein